MPTASTHLKRNPVHKQTRDKILSKGGSVALNSGICVCCGESATWRSLTNRCWTCEKSGIIERREAIKGGA